ncbi:hypothetical protein WJX72_010523 [[Myrmecia] bisecta]|uniref:Elongation factor 3 n=1 Tax=[Myrmecia] bisecta TaxID=41462 RepID=A0AAW1R9J7_9CHLO
MTRIGGVLIAQAICGLRNISQDTPAPQIFCRIIQQRARLPTTTDTFLSFMAPTTEVAAPIAVPAAPIKAMAAEAAPAPVETKESLAVKDLVARINAGQKSAAADVAAHIKAGGIGAFKAYDLLDQIQAAANDLKAPAAREAALATFTAIIQDVGRLAEPYMVPQLATILDRYGDKVAPVRAAAADAGIALMGLLCPHAVGVVLPILFAGMEQKRLWQTKVGALELLGTLTKTAPKQLSACLPDIVPIVSECMVDAKPQVKEAAIKAMTQSCSSLGNRDIEPFVPSLIACIARPAETPDCVHKLSATTFVQAVEAPTLSILIPLLVRGLRERQTAVKRKAAVIIDNMAKLVDNPADATVFLPRLLPGLEFVAKEVSDPECRNVAARAVETLQRVGIDSQTATPEGEAPKSAGDKLQAVRKALDTVLASHKAAVADAATLEFIAATCAHLCVVRSFDENAWELAVTPYLLPFMGQDAADQVTAAFLAQCKVDTIEKAAQDVSDDEGEELCNCEFSLAYGGKILLNNATLHLKRGRRYGLCGPNGAGKSTLMRAIANGQLDGFPPKDQLRTVYVEHDIDASESEAAVVEFVYSDPILQDASHPAHGEVERVLESVGFTSVMQQQAVGSLSGGWKMKLALARAMLMKADIMLLDEPTNHLDVTNVAWLEGYLNNLPQVTSMVVSHDSGFLDNVCTDIIHYEGRKLRKYKGNLSEFVKRVPEARSYYTLAAATQKFVLPEPGFLEGIKSKDRAILKMQKVAFRYPGAEKPLLQGVTIQCSLNSRVAILGANGAGKSTMIKLLTGELEPESGIVWKHPNMRVAYVAQHAFHHVEQHLDKTPNEYIQWRYAIGEDRENLEKVTRQVKEEEKAKMEEKVVVDGAKKVVESILGRRKLKRSYEYEVAWVGLHPDQNSWLTRDRLEEMGFTKMLNEIDVKEAARAGLATRPLTQKEIEKHLKAVGIDPEFGTHSHIRGLSGGQKVKVVLAAAMWNNPHMLVLDEPTNYLDRDSLGALAGAIKDYGGGVIMISHNREFTKELCSETWTVACGQLLAEGEQPALAKEAAKLEWKAADEMIDAFGNIVKIKQPKKKLSNKEKKQRAKVRKARRERGEEVSDSEEEDF